MDSSASRLAEARRLAFEHGMEIDFVQGDATRLPLPADTFDYAWSRFLLEYLPDPERALVEHIRVTRPGGTVVVADLDGQIEQLYPLDGPLQEDLDEGLRILAETGFDTRVGRKLYHWCFRAGLQNIAVHVEPHQVCAGRISPRDIRNWHEKLATAAAFLAKHSGDVERWTGVRDLLLAQIQRPDSFYYCTLIVVRGTVPCMA